MTDIGKRKQDHIELALKSEHQSKADSSFDTVRFEHNALPEISLSDISLNCEFLNQNLAAPLMICAMTGGWPNIKSSANRTAKGSSPTSGSAHNTACPKPNGRGCRTYTQVMLSGLMAWTMANKSYF